MPPPVKALGTLRDQVMHDASPSYPTMQLALEGIKNMPAKPGVRGTAMACAVCRGWHIVEVSGRA